VAVTHIEQRAQILVGSGCLAGLFLVEHAVLMREVVFLQFVEVFLQIPKMAWFDGDIYVTVFKVALNPVLLDTLPDDLVAPPAHVPEQVINFSKNVPHRKRH